MVLKANNKKKDFKIDFIGIGASRSATTWIYKCISEHPEACVSSKKEIGFFNDENYDYSKGIKFYKTFFDHCKNDSIKGEYSPNYLRDAKKTSKRIYKNFHNAKLLVSLRNPIDRAYSDFLYSKNKEKDFSGDFSEALKESKKGNNYLEKGKYYTKLKHFFNLFPKENIHVSFYGDLEEDPKDFIQEIYKFLEINPEFKPSMLEKTINPSTEKPLHIPFINNLINKTARSKNKYLSSIKKLLKLFNVHKLTNYLKSWNKTKFLSVTSKREAQKMSEKTRKKLYDFYKKDIKKLEKLLDKDLSHWK